MPTKQRWQGLSIQYTSLRITYNSVCFKFFCMSKRVVQGNNYCLLSPLSSVTLPSSSCRSALSKRRGSSKRSYSVPQSQCSSNCRGLTQKEGRGSRISAGLISIRRPIARSWRCVATILSSIRACVASLAPMWSHQSHAWDFEIIWIIVRKSADFHIEWFANVQTLPALPW